MLQLHSFSSSNNRLRVANNALLAEPACDQERGTCATPLSPFLQLNKNTIFSIVFKMFSLCSPLKLYICPKCFSSFFSQQNPISYPYAISLHSFRAWIKVLYTTIICIGICKKKNIIKKFRNAKTLYIIY